MADSGRVSGRPSGRVRDKAGGRRHRVALAAAVLAASFVTASPTWADEPAVVVSIKPIHSLATSLMEGIAVPALLVEGAASPHAWTLRPSQAAALAEADLVVWIGDGLENFLAVPMASLVREGAGLELAALPELGLLPVREGGVWGTHEQEANTDDPDDEAQAGEAHEDDEAYEHGHAGYDAHVWLDPANAIVIARAIAARLAVADPAHADAYEANLAALIERLTRLDEEVAARLAPVRDVPFIVFHDAYQYFERHYGLAAAGSLALDPEQSPGAARLSAIRARLAAGDVACAFAEPLFDPSLLAAAIEGTGVRMAYLDPEGVDLAPGRDLYFDLVGGIADAIAVCLEPRT